jgi:siroheme synthase
MPQDPSIEPPERAPAWHRGFFYLIGCGPGGPQTATLQALNAIKRMEVILASPRHARLFAEYLGDTPVAFDPFEGFWDFQGRRMDQLEPADQAGFKKWRDQRQAEHLARIKEFLDQGLDVGLLDQGNPCLFGPGNWYAEQLDPRQVVIIPGMGAESAALAAVKACALPAHKARFLLQSAPIFLNGQGVTEDLTLEQAQAETKRMLTALAGVEHSMILYMALSDLERNLVLLREHLDADLPAAVVFWAGDMERQRVVRGTVGDLAEKLGSEVEHFMGILLLGRFLEGKPFTVSQDKK